MPPRPIRLVSFAIAISLLAAAPVLAGGGGGLPWEGPLQQIQQSITGPVAGFIALAAVAVFFAAWPRARRELAAAGRLLTSRRD